MGDAGRLTEVGVRKASGAARPGDPGLPAPHPQRGQRASKDLPVVRGVRGARWGRATAGRGCHGGAWPAFITENENN